MFALLVRLLGRYLVGGGLINPDETVSLLRNTSTMESRTSPAGYTVVEYDLPFAAVIRNFLITEPGSSSPKSKIFFKCSFMGQSQMTLFDHPTPYCRAELGVLIAFPSPDVTVPTQFPLS
jgi:hypothetical protein